MSLLPAICRQYINMIDIDKLGGNEAVQHIEVVNKDLVRVRLTFDLNKTTCQDDWQVRITPAFAPTFNWSPHLTPNDKNIIDQHVFRSPALIVADEKAGMVIIPDLDILSKESPVRWYMDMNARKNVLTLGMSNTIVPEHVLYERTTGAEYPVGKVEFGFYIMVYKDKKDLENPFRKPLAFFWDKWGKKQYHSGQQTQNDLEPYVKYTYNWAFNTWKESVWQEFTVDGKKVGAPVFIVNKQRELAEKAAAKKLQKN